MRALPFGRYLLRDDEPASRPGASRAIRGSSPKNFLASRSPFAFPLFAFRNDPDGNGLRGGGGCGGDGGLPDEFPPPFLM